MRVDQAASNLAQAWSGGHDYNTDVGQRLARWSAALQVAIDRPLAGAGAGGYALAIDALGYGALARRNEHAHSTYLHEAATTGVVGLGLMLASFGLCLRRLPAGEAAAPYAGGTLFVLFGWLVGGLFDCYQLNGTMFGLFAFIAALGLKHPGAPDPRG
jgi:O-antigen ligase